MKALKPKDTRAVTGGSQPQPHRDLHPDQMLTPDPASPEATIDNAPTEPPQ